MSYEEFISSTDLSNHDLQFYLDGMNEENGEISGIFKRVRRGDYGQSSKSHIENQGIHYAIEQNKDIKKDIIKEIGDRHWYTLRLLQTLEVKWEDIIYVNWEKLKKRHEQGKIMGKGDNREDEV